MPGPRVDELDETELVRAVGRGDDTAMAEVVRRYRLPVVAFARRVVGDQFRAEEIAQDVFVRLWERSDRFDAGRGALRSFLLALTHGRSIDVARSDTARRGREERASRRPTERARLVDEVVEQRTVAEAVRDALGRISESERAAVELAYFGGHSYRTVAEMLGEPEGTIKSRIRTGLARLRSELASQELQGG